MWTVDLPWSAVYYWWVSIICRYIYWLFGSLPNWCRGQWFISNGHVSPDLHWFYVRINIICACLLVTWAQKFIFDRFIWKKNKDVLHCNDGQTDIWYIWNWAVGYKLNWLMVFRFAMNCIMYVPFKCTVS